MRQRSSKTRPALFTPTRTQTHTHRSPSPTCVVGQPPVVHVKQEPSLLPRLDPPPSLGQEAGAASGRQPQVSAGGHAMTQRLQVGAEVKVGGEEERQLLGAHTEVRCVEGETGSL